MMMTMMMHENRKFESVGNPPLLSPDSVTEKVVVEREGEDWDLITAPSSTTKFPFFGLSLKGEWGITRLSGLDSKESVRRFMLGCWFRWTEEHKPINLFECLNGRKLQRKRKVHAERERRVEWKWEREKRRKERKKVVLFWRYEK